MRSKVQTTRMAASVAAGVVVMMIAVIPSIASSPSFVRVHVDEEVTFQGQPLDSGHFNWLECSVWCLGNDVCQGLVWDSLINDCQVYSDVNVTHTDPSPGTSKHIYFLSSVQVPDDWMHNSALPPFKLLPGPWNWLEARQACKDVGATLSFVDDHNLLKAVRRDNNINGFFVGLSRVDDSLPYWYDELGNQYNNDSLFWSATEPDPNEMCIAFWGVLSNIHCNQPYSDTYAFCIKDNSPWP